MRLLAVCQVDRPGGPEIGLLRLLTRLAGRGWDVALTSPGHTPAVELTEAGYPWEALEVGGLEHGAGARAVASWPRARKLSREVDVTYLNGTVAGRLLPALRGHATVLHVHDIVDRVPRHWHGADLVLADSRAVGARLDPLDVHVIGCPVDLDPPRAGTPPWPTDGQAGPRGPVVGFVGRLVPRKGALDLVKAAPAIRAARPDVRIVIVGDDPYADEESDYAAAVRASDEVEHVGRVTGAASILGHLDALVLPSRQEPFGTVVAEAMAAGTPVVATRVDGLPELVADGVTGALVEPGDTAALAVAVLRVLDDHAAMSAAARAAAERFGADAYAERVHDLLVDVLPGIRAEERRRGLHDGAAT
ncbi:MAG TPA: glycosyltransferase family 4 protein [Baekduia sp.]|uniref:glycosyltransferase family 4 protein n=1 Tax=Baekduia sp. TaxID=2600305 RepID=UPI002D76D3AB|nr:glycosyltransferase family 4 protein [Baekduia sp.]HET6509457.1 glycosyltransferase family 4 protein [Baekduia sp.]